jgi:hypothetical protein
VISRHVYRKKLAKFRKVETHPVISPSSENETRKIYAKKMCGKSLRFSALMSVRRVATHERFRVFGLEVAERCVVKSAISECWFYSTAHKTINN